MADAGRAEFPLDGEVPLEGEIGLPDVRDGVAAIPGRIAARIDRLPLTRVQWELAILTQIAWGLIIVDTDGIAGRLYPFIWRPQHLLTTNQYSIIQALEVGLGVLIGAFTMGFLSDRYGRRPAMLAAALLAGFFVWPFAYVHSFWGLALLSILSTLGVGAIVATHAVYISEIVSPLVRNKVMLGAQGVTALVAVASGLAAYYWIPAHWQVYVWVMSLSQLLILFPLLLWRLPESPRWLEAHARHEEAEQALSVLENRTRKALGTELPEPVEDANPVVPAGKGAWKQLFTDPQYRPRTILLMFAWFLGYPGIVYGVGAFAAVYMVDHGLNAHFIFLLITIGGVFRFAGFMFNSRLGERLERRDVILAVSLIFAISWLVMYTFPNKPTIAIFYTIGGIAGSLWLFNMYNFTAVCFPTRMRSLAFSWTDGLAHIGAWIGISQLGFLYTSGPNHLGWILFIAIPGAIVPSLAIRSWGILQREAVLEQVAT